MITNTSWRIKKMIKKIGPTDIHKINNKIKKFNRYDRTTWPSDPVQQKKVKEETTLFSSLIDKNGLTGKMSKDVKNSDARAILKSIKPTNFHRFETRLDTSTPPTKELNTTREEDPDLKLGIGSMTNVKKLL